MSEQARFKFINIDSSLKEYVCNICHDIPKVDQHRVTICDHIFCDWCLNQWFRICPTHSCPLCRRSIQEFKEDGLKKNAFRDLEVVCDEDGCNYRCNYNEFDKHLCMKVQVACSNAALGCSFKPSRDQKELHEKTDCPYRILKCELCDQKIRNHLKQEHLERTCSESSVPCPFGILGCYYKGARKTIKQHIKTQNEKHSKLLLDYLHELLVPNASELKVVDDQLSLCQFSDPVLSKAVQDLMINRPTNGWSSKMTKRFNRTKKNLMQSLKKSSLKTKPKTV